MFTLDDAALIESLGISSLKIPSHEIANTALHRFASEMFSCVYVSLGAGTWNEVEGAISIYSDRPDLRWVGMHCVSSYPVPPEKANLSRLSHLKSRVKSLGYSDHTQDCLSPALAVALGAEVIEKHFTSDNNLPGRDNKFALNAANFKTMVQNIELAEKITADLGIGPQDIEEDTIKVYRGRWSG